MKQADSMNPTDDLEGVAVHEKIWTKLYLGHTAFSFVGHRRRWYILSSIVILVGMAALGIRGLNFGIEFKGGTSWEITNSALTVNQARAVVSSLGIKQATVVSLGSGTSTSIEVQADLSSYSAQVKANLENKVTDALASAARTSPSKVSLNDVGPTWGGEITSKALRALAGFLVAITLYITLRFELRMAAAALIAVVHDVLVTVGIYALVGFQVTPATVIALLTILGYSLYDTIVVFDRVQENVKAQVNTGKMTYSDAVDASMNQVLMRSMNTSIVAIIPILSVLLIGAEILGATTLQQFGLALFIGLTTGAYSSLFIASPILAQLKEREPRYRSLAARLSKGSTSVIAPKKARSESEAFLGAGATPQASGLADSAAEDGFVAETDGDELGKSPKVARPKLVEPGYRSTSNRSKKSRSKRRY